MSFATARRSSPEDYLMAAQMVCEGYGYQNAARIAGVDQAVLKAFKPKQMVVPPMPEPKTVVQIKTVYVPVPAKAARKAKAKRKAARVIEPKPMSAKVRAIVQSVAKAHGVTMDDMLSERRSRPIAWPRQEAMWRVRQATPFSYPTIGRLFGGRDHTTVLHGVTAFEARLRPWLDVMEALARAA